MKSNLLKQDSVLYSVVGMVNHYTIRCRQNVVGWSLVALNTKCGLYTGPCEFAFTRAFLSRLYRKKYSQKYILI
jgi:hypothetical protein